MIMKKYILPLVVAFLYLSCGDKDYDDLSGTETIKGVAAVYDTLSGVSSLSITKNLKVYLRNKNDSTGFLYFVTTNEQGNFSFNGIDPLKSYSVYASIDTGSVKYTGTLDFPGGSHAAATDTLKLFPSTIAQNGIHLMVKDEQGRPVPGITAWVFNSQILFTSDTSAGRVFDITVNNYGVGNRLNIAPGTYYLRAKTRIGNLDLAGETSVVVPAKGIADATIILRNIPLARNGIEATIKDNYLTPVSGAKVFAYKSQLLFERDTLSYSNSLFTMTSNQLGIASAYIIEPGTYYLRALKVINTDSLKATSVVTVTNNAITPVQMMLR